MRFMHLIMFPNFIQILNYIRKHPTKNDYFSTHIHFTTIYLLQGQKLNSGNYSKQEIIMSNFVQATEHEVCLYAKFESLDIHRYL
jgi:hypothetical protein